MNYLFGALALGAICLTSCSDDDETVDNGIAGSYTLRAVNTATATDFNEDGTANINQMQESGCYNSGKITLNSDNTWSYVITGILIDTEDGSVGCKNEYTASGTWALQSGTDDDAVISAAYRDQNGDNKTVTLLKDDTTITIEDDNILSNYPDRNQDGEPFYRQGSIEYVFRK